MLAGVVSIFLHFSNAQAVPIYMSPESAFPSGEFTENFLLSHTVMNREQEWFKVKTERGEIGWARKNGFYFPLAGNNRERVVADERLPLYREADPRSQRIRELKSGDRIRLLAKQILTWGQAILSNHELADSSSPHKAWWPMPKWPNRLEKTAVWLTTNEVFGRKIFDLAVENSRIDSSTHSDLSAQNFQILSAKGVYKSLDGKKWQKLEQFAESDYPVAINAKGRVYVGPYYSDDQGLSFQEYVRWDSLVDAIKSDLNVEPEQLKLLQLRAASDGNKIDLKIDIGLGRSVVAHTEDAGENWDARSLSQPLPLAKKALKPLLNSIASTLKAGTQLGVEHSSANSIRKRDDIIGL